MHIEKYVTMICGMTENQQTHCANTLATIADALAGVMCTPSDIEAAKTAMLWAALEAQVGGPEAMARLINQGRAE